MRAKHQYVLALGFGKDFDTLAGRILLLNFRATRAALLEDGVRALERSGEPIRAVLVSIPHSLGDIDFALRRLRDRASSPHLRFVAVGAHPGQREQEELRRAGVEFALWNPFDDAALRFVLNEAVQDPSAGESRHVLRAPTTMLARVFSAAGQKAALVYNLSEGGAYLETLRPTSAKGHIRVEIPLPTGTVTLEAQVVTTNVPGNIQKANLPMGMGVEFTDVPEETRCALAEYVEGLAELFRIDKPEPASR
jgi:CheY-like chemotaxis protein